VFLKGQPHRINNQNRTNNYLKNTPYPTHFQPPTMSTHPIVPLPPYTFRLRLAQFILAVLVLILAIVATAIFFSGALGYGIFTPLATCVIVAYWYYSSYRNKQYYNRWVILSLDCFCVIWWLSLWSVMAQWASTLGFIDSLDAAAGWGNLGDVRVVHALTAIAAVLGAAEL
jgi:hypothetical protein